MPKTCCGQPVRRVRERRKADRPLPANPKISGGTRLLYLGLGEQKLVGSATGSVYYVSDRRRSFTVAAADVAGLVRNRTIIIAP